MPNFANAASSRPTAQSNSVQSTLNIEGGKFMFTTATDSEAKRGRKVSKTGPIKKSDRNSADNIEETLLTHNMSEGADATIGGAHLPCSVNNGVYCDQDHDCCRYAKEWQQRYADLEKRFSVVEKELNELKELKDAKQVKTHFKKLYKSDAAQANEIKQLRYKLDLLTNTVVRFEEKLKEANDKMMAMQARSMRRNLVISGLKETNNETPQVLSVQIADFLREKVGFQDHVPLKTFHRLGYVDGSGYRPTIIKLADLNQKYPILALAPQLKGKKNDKQKFYYISEQLPDQLQEDRKYAQFWIQQNKKLPVGEQKSMKIYRNRLNIDNRPYQRKVHPPSSAEVLKMDLQDLVQVKQAPTVYGNSEDLDGSEFISYAMKASKAEDVRLAYRKLRIKYADATHIISAHRFAPPDGPINQEATDDGEWGGGRCLLRSLQDLKLTNVAVFIVRYYGGRHVGAARFDLMEKLTKTALRKAGFLITPKRGPLTRARSQQLSAPQNAFSADSPGRASSFGLPSENDQDTDSLRTADEDVNSQIGSEITVPSTDDESTPQVVINFRKNLEFASANEDNIDSYADNEASESEPLEQNK